MKRLIPNSTQWTATSLIMGSMAMTLMAGALDTETPDRQDQEKVRPKVGEEKDSEAESQDEAFSPAPNYQALTWSLYRELSKENDEDNFLFSPLSLGIVLDGLRLGAHGATAEEIENVLGLGVSDGDEAEEGSVGTISKAYGASGEITLSLANALWVSPKAKLLDDYVQGMKEHFDAEATSCDFDKATLAAERINEWTREHTNQHIDTIVSPDDFNPNTRLAITNATYFKASWQRPFEVDNTSDGPFIMANGEEVIVPLMTSTQKFPHATLEDGTQVLEMPYTNGHANLIVILPSVTEGLTALEESITPVWMAKVDEAMTLENIKLTLPRFELDGELPVIKLLKSLGVEKLFSMDEADLSGMSESDALYCSAFNHKSRLKVDEQGSEGAAASAAVVGLRSFQQEVTEFRADRPFMFALRDKASEEIIFVGRLMKPEVTEPESETSP